MPLITLLCLC